MGRRRPFPCRRSVPRPLAVAIRALLSGGVLLAGAVRPVLAELPVPCAAGTCGAGGPSVWVSSGAATSAIVANTLNIDQTTQKAIFNWQSFNVSAGSTVNFNQPNSSAIALNRVLGTAVPSRILGTINANGQIYLINPNGIVFGHGAQVNVGALVASTLDVDDQVFRNNSILQPIQDGKPAFTAGTGMNPAAAITVEQGAALKAAGGGSIMIFAPTVSNAGDIETPDGQTILAAGKDEVYLQQSGDPKLRGLLVEVKTGGDVTNLGRIAAQRGDVTLLGFAVNQSGLVSATTSVRVNGSIRLLARDGGYVDTSGNTPVLRAGSTVHGSDAATVSFGGGSVTQVLPELDDPTTAPDSQTQNPSTVEVMGRRITLQSGSLIHAPAGKVTLTATATPDNTAAPTTANDSRIQLDDGSRIDVAGTTSTVLPMSRNTVQVDMRGYVLRDAPLQRNGTLYGKTVTVDIRKGTSLVDWQSTAAGIGRTIDERSAHGGDVSFVSGGDVTVGADAVMDVSGGTVGYQSGYINATKLIADGQRYDISQADPNRQYQIAGQYTYTYRKWGVTRTWQGAAVGGVGDWQPGYVQGADAGTVSFKTPALALAGTIRADTVQGPYQRGLPGQPSPGGGLTPVPLGGGLNIDLNGTSDASRPTQNVILQSGPQPATTPDLQIDPGVLGRQGVSRLTVTTDNGAVHIAGGAELRLPAGGSVDLTGNLLDIQGGIDIPGGSATFRTVAQGSGDSPIRFGAASHVDVAGQWVNDSPLLNPAGATGAVAIGGGRITAIAQGDVTLAAGSVLDVGGGAWLQANGAVTGGKAGSITLATAQVNGGSRLDLGGNLRGYALTGGGALSIAANSILIQAPGAPVSPDPVPGELRLAPDFFRRGGFQSYSLTSNLGDLTVGAGAEVAPQVSNLALNADAASQAGGADLAGFSHVTLLPQQDRSAASLSLAVNRSLLSGYRRAVLDIQAGAVIRTDPGAGVSLFSDDSIRMAGTIDAPGGSIALHAAPPPKQTADPGFLRDQGIWLGSQARLLAPAYALTLPDDTGLRAARLLPGGQITLQADRGYIVAAAGSRMDVSGIARTLDLPAQYTAQGVRYGATDVSAPAGTVSLTAAEGMLLDGALQGGAAAAGAAGGTLQITMDSSTLGGHSAEPGGVPAGHEFPTNPDIVQINAGGGPVTPPDLAAGNGMPVSVPDTVDGTALISAETLQAGGFDSLVLNAGGSSGTATGQVRFQGDVSLAAGRSLILQASIVNAPGDINLSAPYVALGGRVAAAGPATRGGGRVRIDARQIDVTGNAAFQGVGAVSLASTGDIRLEGLAANQTSDSLTGSLEVAGDLALQADQVYPTTLSRFTVDAGTGTLRIGGGTGGTPVLSAGGQLTLHAAHILQGGVIKAPLGQISLQADQDLTLGAGSVTSVSAEGQTIPFGLTQFGTDWLYFLPYSNRTLVEAPPPAKHISLTGHDVTVAAGAVVDLSGGGDLLAYEFVPGIGGSTDVLDPSATGAKYAILPGYQGSFAPYDAQIWAGAGLQMGDSVYLAGGGGLAAGNYVLLPARYALLPGAFLVTPVSGSRDIAPGQPLTRSDGASIVAGQRTVAGTGIRASRWSGFVVEPGSIARTRSEYTLSLANTLFAKQAAVNGTPVPLLPDDAGQLTISADGSIGLQGQLRGAPVSGGREARVDIAATDMTVVNALDPHAAGVQLLASDLNGLGASLLLGGTRSPAADGTQLDVTAGRVTVQDGVTLKGPEVLLAATDVVDVGAGATVAGTGQAGPTDATLVIDGDGALLRVSAGGQVDVRRTGTTGAAGTLNIGAGAVVQADHAIAMDATAGTTLAGRLDIASGGSLNLGADRISLGAAPTGTGGLVLATADLNALQLGQLTLTSRSALDLYGAVNLNAQQLRIDAAGLAGHGAAGDRTLLSADSVQLDNTAGAAAGTPAAGSGDLTVDARNLTVGPGDFAVDGFKHITLSAAQQLSGQGTGGLHAGGDLTLQAGRVTAASGAATTFDGGAHTVTVTAAPAAVLPAADSLGATLTISGRRILQQGRIELHAGTVNLTATGNGGGDGVTLAAGSVTDVSGTGVVLGDVTRYAPGGTVGLTAAHGDVVAEGAVGGQAASVVDVSGPGNAGALKVQAPEGNVDLAGDLRGGGAGQQQGGFTLDAMSIRDGAGQDDFAGLNRRLNGAGFTDVRHLRLRQGDLVLNGGATPVIQARDLNLTADAGGITVTGTGAPVIAATGADGGHVVLAARDGIELGGGATLDAHGTAAAGAGGRVELDSTDGAIRLDTGSDINVAGGNSGPGGSVALRVARTVLTGGAGVVADGTVEGAAGTTVEAYQAYQSGTGIIGVGDMNTYRQDAQNFMANAAGSSLMADLAAQGFTLIPGTEVDGSGDLALGADWDLHTWRFGPDGVPGVLTLRAAGNLTFNHALSDGFDAASTSQGRLLADRSWSYRLVGGADTASAGLLAVRPATALAAGTGNVTVGANYSPQTIRTGTGSIAIAAGGDLVLGDAGSTIYTAGKATGAGTYGPLLSYILPGDYPTGGGDLAVQVQGDVQARPATQLITDWLRRVGYGDPSSYTGLPTTWNISFGSFHQGIGALGGGSVTVQAGGDITNLDVSVPTTGKQVGTPVGPGRIQVTDNQLAIQGGGSIVVRAGGNIGSGVFFEDGGTATIQAGGSIDAAPGNAVKTILALGNGRFNLQAGRDIALETVLNPTVVKQSASGAFAPSVFFTYGADSVVNLTALGGDVRLYNDTSHIADSSRFPGVGYTSYGNDPVLKGALTIYPGTLRVDALRGDIALKNGLTLYPSAAGQLEMLAAGSVGTLDTTNAQVILSDADPALLPTMQQPQTTTDYSQVTTLRFDPSKTAYFHAATPVHTGDTVPVRIVAGKGDIGGAGTGQTIVLYLAKQARIQAGRDILNLILHGQNLTATDVTAVQAGRDIRSVASRDPTTGVFLTNNNPFVELGGGGQLQVLAGRNLDLGAGDGIITTGAQFNPALAGTGAGVTVMAGLSQAPDYAGFIDAYLGAGGGYDALVTTYMQGLSGDGSLDAATALARFKALPPVLQRSVVLQAFFNELQQSGIAATGGGKDYSRGYAAIATLFPGGPGAYHGDISLPFSRIQTLAGGDINILAPGGQVDGGLASNAVVVKSPSQLGIVTLGLGDINGFVDGDFLVNQSRVFALDGGNILLWSTHGNIDAGRGAKTALAASPPVITVDPTTGQVIVSFPPTVAGSGIRNGVSTPGRNPGNIYLFAPGGVVNAGDAGIGSLGNLTIGATQVIGGDNISVGGVSVGVPAADTSSLAAGLTGVSSLSSTVSKSAEEATQSIAGQNTGGPGLGADTLTLIDVQVLGYGE